VGSEAVAEDCKGYVAEAGEDDYDGEPDEVISIRPKKL
jgi:hypothetical protein